jgi:hypothetical protein
VIEVVKLVTAILLLVAAVLKLLSTSKADGSNARKDKRNRDTE